MPRTTAEDVLLEVLRNADGEWTGKTKLFKAFYFAHLYYAKDRPGLLTDWPIARMPHGPGIDNYQALFGALEAKGHLAIELVHQGPLPEYRYRLSDKGKEVAPPPDDARAAIKEAVLFCLPCSAGQVTACSGKEDWLH
jgi:hypothetical protein